MARIPDRLLEHTVVIRGRRPMPTSTGELYLPEVTTRAIVVDKQTKITDQREDTAGQELLADSHVLVQPEFYAPPGSLVTVWPGTPMERKLTVARTAYGEHSIAWSSAQFWLV